MSDNNKEGGLEIVRLIREAKSEVYM